MSSEPSFVFNSLGRAVPATVNQRRVEPFPGVGKYRPRGRKHGPPIRSSSDYPNDGDKTLGSLEEALIAAGLRDGMTIGTHHHLRNGDRVAMMALQAARKLGCRELVWFPSSSFPCHDPVIELLDSGIIRHVEGNLSGALGEYCSRGRMKEIGVLRSHGGRWRAIESGEVVVDIAVIAAPAADRFGNATGAFGKGACGSLNFSLADSIYANRVIVVTEDLVPFPCAPWQISGNNVDYVVSVDTIGDPTKISTKITRPATSPERRRTAQLVADFIAAARILRPGFSFQAGAGSISQAAVEYLSSRMRAEGIKARFIRGGSNRLLVELLREGLADYLLDGQAFDQAAIASIRHDPRHIATSPFNSYNPHGKGNFASLVDVAVLGATEVDLDFNANVVTHPDGMIRHVIGGWQDCLFSRCAILAVPSLRNRVPVIVDQVTTITGSSELIDVVVTERGIAINPRRPDLIEAVKNQELPLKKIEDLKREIHSLSGGTPERPRLAERAVAVVTWVDGTIMDTVFQVAETKRSSSS